MDISDGLGNSILDTTATAHFEGGKMEFRSGAKPGDANAAATGTVLATIEIPADGFTTAASRQINLSDIWEDLSADAAGTIGWARITTDADAGGNTPSETRADFTVTATGGGGEITVDNTVVAVGQAIKVTSFSITMPASSS